MKKQLTFAVLVLLLATGCNQQKQEQPTMNKESNELTAFDVQEAFEKNAALHMQGLLQFTAEHGAALKDVEKKPNICGYLGIRSGRFRQGRFRG